MCISGALGGILGGVMEMGHVHGVLTGIQEGMQFFLNSVRTWMLPLMASCGVIALILCEQYMGRLKRAGEAMEQAEDEAYERLNYELEAAGGRGMIVSFAGSIAMILLLATGYSTKYIESLNGSGIMWFLLEILTFIALEVPKHKEFFAKLGVHSLIYPEMLAARDIVDAVKMSWIRQWWEFAGGALVLLGTKMREKAEILNVPLHELGGRNIPFHIVAIKRGNETIIPRGDDVIKLNDIVYFTTTKKYIPYIRKISGKENEADVRNVMIMGGSRIAVRTVQYMPDYMKAKIIESNIARCNRLTELVDDGVMVINGDGRDMQLLMEEGIKNTEAFVALTGNSETNILACLAAKRMGVTKTVAEVENVDYISMAESLDIGTVINKKFIAASHIYQMMLDADVSNVKCLTFANADVAEFTVKPGAKITKQAVKDLGLPKGATIGGLIRNGEGILVTGNTMIQENDHVVVFCLGMMIKKLEKYF